MFVVVASRNLLASAQRDPLKKTDAILSALDWRVDAQSYSSRRKW